MEAGDVNLGNHHHCTFAVLMIDREAVTIKDLNIGKSVTNDAEHVVAQLKSVKVLKAGMKLFYEDTQGDVDEILWEGPEIAFRPGPGRKAP